MCRECAQRGCSCTLSLNRLPCRYPALHVCSFSLLLSKGARSRFGEDQLVSKLVIKAIADSLGVPTEVREGWLPPCCCLLFSRAAQPRPFAWCALDQRAAHHLHLALPFNPVVTSLVYFPGHGHQFD